jgi:hypothetical protein
MTAWAREPHGNAGSGMQRTEISRAARQDVRFIDVSVPHES